MAELEGTDYAQAEPEVTAGLLDEGEFSRAFEVFSDGDEVMSTANSVLNPFLKSLGIKVEPNSPLVAEIKDNSDHGNIQKIPLKEILIKHIPTLRETWPAHNDVLRAFRVFDTEGVGFIKVTMLKRFLVQSQLDVEESVLERLIRDNCQIDGDDLINYTDFVQSVSRRFDSMDSEHY